MRKEIKMKMINFFKVFCDWFITCHISADWVNDVDLFLFKTEKKLQKHDSHKSDSINSDNVIDIKTKKESAQIKTFQYDFSIIIF